MSSSCFLPYQQREFVDDNSKRNHLNQSEVLASVAGQISECETAIVGVIIESSIYGGRQDIPSAGSNKLKYGVSITDPCVDLETTVGMLNRLNEVG